jgi:hypothetical protein
MNFLLNQIPFLVPLLEKDFNNCNKLIKYIFHQSFNNCIYFFIYVSMFFIVKNIQIKNKLYFYLIY